MTEVEWLACDDPERMLGFLRGQASERKLRLFAVACCRLAGWPGRDVSGLEMAERYADGLIGAEELWAAYNLLPDCRARAVAIPRLFGEDEAVAVSWRFRPAARLWSRVGGELHELPAGEGPGGAGQAHCDLFRDIAGAAFRRVTFPPAWRNAEVEALARVAYEDRPAGTVALDGECLAVLADALEDASCADPDLLGHLRSPGPHVRGCWALDLVLAKE